MSNIIFFFPGQGSQFPGMAKDLFERYDAVKALFVQASEACGRDMKALLFDGSEEDLKDTQNAQPAIALASLASREAMAAEGFESAGAAGHSLGEYSALVDAGVLSPAAALKAVSARGAFMAFTGAEIVAEKGEIGMAAVVGIGPDPVRAALSGHEDVWIANENGPSQVAIGGTKAGMNAAEGDLKAAGARRIVPLKVSCPFHTPLMAAPAESMRKVLEGLTFADPAKKLWSNVSASLVATGEEARKLLIEQITHPVRWVDLMASIAESSPTALYETGPGKVLTGLWARSGHEGTCCPGGSVGDIDTVKKIRSQ